MNTKKFLITVATILPATIGSLFTVSTGWATDLSVDGFLSTYCLECHSGAKPEGGLDLKALGEDLREVATFDRWLRLYDRVEERKMPPRESLQPSEAERAALLRSIREPLSRTHAESKETVRRRLNRSEFNHTINDLFGTQLNLASMLPEDGRSHEFDNVAESLSVSMAQVERYLEIMDTVLASAIAESPTPPEVNIFRASYAETEDAKQFLGKQWHRLGDGAVVFYKRFGYPTGMLRSAHANHDGFHRIRVTGYAYQSQKPITFSVGATSFGRGSEKPIFGYYAMPPGKPTTIELEAYLEARQMIELLPWGIYDVDSEIKNKGVENYAGPGLAVLSVELEGPLHREYPSPGHHLLYDGLSTQPIAMKKRFDKRKDLKADRWEVISENPTDDASRTIRRIAEKAFRRPVDWEMLKPYEDLFHQQIGLGYSFDQALRSVVTAIFCSPDFLYLHELPGKLDDYALASRLSYFLTRTLPDSTLLETARAGQLTSQPTILMRECERLLNDSRSVRFINDFCDAWLNLRDIDFTNPDQILFPEFDVYLRTSMVEETRFFFRELVMNNLGVRNIISSDFAMLNERLAQHYAIEGVIGPEIRRVSLPKDSLRGGLLTQASVLKVTANGTNTSPVVRGVWVTERILGKTPDPPPPGVPGIEPDTRGTTTLRELLDQHRNTDDCRACHTLIDPPGFALECFDPIGGWRDRFRKLGEGEPVRRQFEGRNVRYKLGAVVDASGELADGRRFDDFQAFRQLLLTDEAVLAKTLVTKLLTFATGREMGFSDRAEIDSIVTDLAPQGYPIRDLLRRVVASEIFRGK